MPLPVWMPEKMAERLEIVDALESLAVHCRPPLMSVDDRSRWMADWCDDLADFPAESIRMACQRWRMGTNAKFPMPGQFIPLVRAVTVTKTPDAAIPKLWKPATEDEYRGMTVREKIRERELLAMEEERLAGPMWGNGEPIHPDDMPSSYYEHKARAADHRAEIKRLREYLGSAA